MIKKSRRLRTFSVPKEGDKSQLAESPEARLPLQKSLPKPSLRRGEKYDVTVIINGHREGNLIVPTLKSVALAQTEALNNGVKCTACVVLDSSEASSSLA